MSFNTGHIKEEDNIDSDVYMDKIKKAARLESSEQRPKSSDTELSTNEQGIINKCTRILRAAKNEAETYLQNLKDKDLSKLYEINIDHFITRFESSIKDLKQSEKPHLTALIMEEEKRKGDLKDFQREHEISRAANYSENNYLAFSILAVMIVIESVLNANMLAKTSVNGLLGGWGVAIFISMANIFSGFITGIFPLRYTNIKKRPNIKFLAQISFIFCCLFIFVFNFIFAHYRLSASPDIFDNVQATLQHIINDPFAIFLDIKSFALFIVGLIFSAVSGWKGYNLDDHYPEYGSIYKKLDTASTDLLTAEDNIRQQVKNLIKNNISELDKIKKQTIAIQRKPDSIIDIYQLELKKYNRFAISLNERMLELISAYRHENSIMRKTPAPGYFSTPPHIPDEDMNLEIDMYKLEKEMGESKEKAENILQQINDVMEKLVSLEPLIMTDLTNYFETMKENLTSGTINSDNEDQVAEEEK